MRPPQWSEVTLRPDTALVGGAVDRICQEVTEAGVEAGEIDGIRLAATEAVTNAVVHGRAGMTAAEVRLRWGWADDFLEIEVSEPGEFNPPTNWRELPEDPLSESGRGGFLIAQAFEDASHHNEDGRHFLRMRKRLPRRGPLTPQA